MTRLPNWERLLQMMRSGSLFSGLALQQVQGHSKNNLSCLTGGNKGQDLKAGIPLVCLLKLPSSGEKGLCPGLHPDVKCRLLPLWTPPQHRSLARVRREMVVGEQVLGRTGEKHSYQAKHWKLAEKNRLVVGCWMDFVRSSLLNLLNLHRPW